MDFTTFIDQAWAEHADDAAAVARRLGDGMPLVSDEAQIVQLANLAHHLHGEHLGEWRAGISFIERLAALPACVPDGPSGQALRRCVASLALSEGAAPEFGTLPPSERIRVGAMAAANLAERDSTRATQLFQRALDEARDSGLPAADPMNRALAVAGNNLASTLEQKRGRSGAERALMLLAAQTARQYWERAGTWLETERAEYRLAMSWLQAGDPARARSHAQQCLAIVAANDGAALERFFGCEALGLAERAAGDSAAHVQALTQARAAFESLDEADKTWCAETLTRLDG